MRVKCECGWTGLDDQLEKKYVSNPHDPTDVFPESVCPNCGSFWVDSIEIVPKKLIEVGYPSGRRVRYLYNPVVSEMQGMLDD